MTLVSQEKREPPILSIDSLSVAFPSEEGWNEVLHGVSWKLKAGTCLGIVGESGSGKSISALSIMGLITKPGKVRKGKISFHSPTLGMLDLRDLSSHSLRKIRGNEIAMIFQEPMSALNPVMRCGNQVVEALRLHKRMSKREAWENTSDLFEAVGLPLKTLKAYPHEISGGQKQRVMIAMAISCDPVLLIADEPTTALDVTIQAKILDLLRKLQAERGLSMVFITHDLGVVAEIADEVLVMRDGKVMEKADIYTLFKNPQHPYTQGLLACRPNLKNSLYRLPTIDSWEAGGKKDMGAKELSSPSIQHGEERTPILTVKGLKKWFPAPEGDHAQAEGWVKAVNEVSFDLYPGETLGLVGESGCGKSTLGRSILRLIQPSAGQVLFLGEDILKLDMRSMRRLRKKLQIIFQDPFSSLNPRKRIGNAIVEAMMVQGVEASQTARKATVDALLKRVGLEASHFTRFPHEFSGGQRQRVCIARALALEPTLIICDESVSALDVSVQAQVLNLLKDLQEERGLTYLFISHDMGVVKHMSDRVMVMRSGEIVEVNNSHNLYQNPQNPYTQELLEAIPAGTLERIQALKQAKDPTKP